jgi:hypothetical protein
MGDSELTFQAKRWISNRTDSISIPDTRACRQDNRQLLPSTHICVSTAPFSQPIPEIRMRHTTYKVKNGASTCHQIHFVTQSEFRGCSLGLKRSSIQAYASQYSLLLPCCMLSAMQETCSLCAVSVGSLLLYQVQNAHRA